MTDAVEPKITVEDLRAKAVHIKDLATAQARHLTHERASQVVAVGVAVACVAVALAYYVGSRRCRA